MRFISRSEPVIKAIIENTLKLIEVTVQGLSRNLSNKIMAQHSLSDKVWLLKGLISSEAGTLTLKNGRLSFFTNKPIFDSPLAEVQAIDFPWYYFGAGCCLKISGTKYKLSFIQPGNTAGGEYASIPDARRKGQRWKTALTHSDWKE